MLSVLYVDFVCHWEAFPSTIFEKKIFLHDPPQSRSADAPVPDAKWTFSGSA